MKLQSFDPNKLYFSIITANTQTRRYFSYEARLLATENKSITGVLARARECVGMTTADITMCAEFGKEVGTFLYIT
jgi:hypothetical protein